MAVAMGLRRKKGEQPEAKVVGYRVVTASLLLGNKVFRKGDFISLEEAKRELDYVEGFRLVEAIYEGDEDDDGASGKSNSKFSAFPLKNPFG